MATWLESAGTLPFDLDYRAPGLAGALRRVLARPFLAPGGDFRCLGVDMTPMLGICELKTINIQPPRIYSSEMRFRRLDPKVRIKHSLTWRAFCSLCPAEHWERVKRAVSQPNNPTELAAVSWGLFALWNPQADAVLEHLERIQFSTFVASEQIAYLKRLHAVVRKYEWIPDSGYVDGAISRLWQYLQDLYNRDLYQQDFRGELAVRSMGEPDQAAIVPGERGVTVSQSLLEHAITEEITAIFDELATKTAAPSESLAEFWARRLEWCASGSAPGARHHMVLEGQQEQTSATKLSLASQLPDDFLEWVLTQDPVTLSKAVFKFENGKNRNLWNCTNGLYYLEAYLSCGFEQGLTGIHGMQITDGGAHALQGALQREAAARSALWVLSYDFSDFNYYHLLRHQAHMVRSIGRARGRGGSRPEPDYERAAEHLAKARLNTVLVDPASDGVVVSDTSLVTGLRLTTVTNTVFNATYMEVARRMLSRWGIVVPTVHDFRLGDDVYSSSGEWNHLAIWAEMVNAMGFTGQGLKIMLDQRGEFLRLEYSKDGIHGYLNRAIPNLVSGEWDLSAGGGMSGKARSLYEMCEKLKRRGAVLHVMDTWRNLVRPLCGSKVYGRTATVPASWLDTHGAFGGANLAHVKDGVATWRPTDFSHIEEVSTPVTPDTAEQLSGPGIQAQLGRVIRLVGAAKGRELSVVRTDLIRSAFAKCWPSSVVRAWHAANGAQWLATRPRKGPTLKTTLVRLSDLEVRTAMATFTGGATNLYTSLRGCWARLAPPVLLAVRLGMRAHGGGLHGLCQLFIEGGQHDLIALIDRALVWHTERQILDWIFDEYCWPAVLGQGLGEYGAAYVRLLADGILAISTGRIPLEQAELERLWLSAWMYVREEGTFVY